MILKSNNSVNEVSQTTGSSQAEPWDQAVIEVNKKVVQPGAPVVLIAGEANILVIKAPPELAEMLRLEVIGETVIDVKPGEPWVAPVENKFQYTLTPQSDHSAQCGLLLVSKEEPSVCTIDCRVVASAPLYEVLIDGEPHLLGTDIYTVRDVMMEIKLIPTVAWGELPVLLMPFNYYKGKYNSEPLAGTPVMVGSKGCTWKLTLSESDSPFRLTFDTLIHTVLVMRPGYHDSFTTLTPITKKPHHTSDWLLGVRAVRNGGEEVSNVKVVWRVNGELRQVATSDTAGYSEFQADNSRPGIYSAELYIKDKPHSVQNITIE